MAGPFPSAWQSGLDGSRQDRRTERLWVRALTEARKEIVRQRDKCRCDGDAKPFEIKALSVADREYFKREFLKVGIEIVE